MRNKRGRTSYYPSFAERFMNLPPALVAVKEALRIKLSDLTRDTTRKTERNRLSDILVFQQRLLDARPLALRLMPYDRSLEIDNELVY